MFLVKSHDISLYGKYPGSRSVDELLRNGIVILDKWRGPTSHDVVAAVKKMLCLKKAGHSGTLDPAVSGVLPIALENACKVMPALQGLDKEYVGVMKLHKDIEREAVESAVKRFTGMITQKPPVRSAVARKERMRVVYSFKIIEMQGRNVLFRVLCQAGTYIRKLIDDMGRQFGGAHLFELRRTRVGRFGEDMAVRMYDLADAYELWKESGSEQIRDFILPVEAAAEHLGKIIVKDSAVHSVASGSPLYTGGISRLQDGIEKGGLVALLTLRGELIAIGNSAMASNEMLRRRGIAAKPDRVIIDRERFK